MDFEAQRKKRLEALEEKKKRLDEMKKIKQERDSAARPSTGVDVSSKERNDVDDLVNSLLQSSSSPPESAEVATQITSTSKPDSQPVATNKTSKDTATTIEPPVTTTTASTVSKSTKPKSFSIAKGLAVYQALPAQVESYEKGTQTDPVDETADWADGDERSSGSGTLLTPYKIAHRRPAPAPSPAPTHRSTSDSTNMTAASGNATVTTGVGSTTSSSSATTSVPKKLSEEQVQTILKDDDFAKFLNRTSHIVERAIGQTSVFDLLESYQLKHPNDQKGVTRALTKVFTFTDDSLKSRPIMDIQFSSHFPELFLVAYGSKSTTSATSKGASSWSASGASATGGQEEALGMVCVWSTGVHTKPEFKFYASSPVLSARFHDTEEHLIVGGCYTGQILVWDMRQKSLPVQRSSLTGKGHKHPIYSMVFVPTVAATTSTATNSVAAPVQSSELLTVSVDGLLCYWDLSRLTEPTNIINLQSLLPSVTGAGTVEALGIAGVAPDAAQQLSLAVTSLALAASASSDAQASKEILLGSGTGHLYRGSLPLRPNQALGQVDAHLGLISAMEMNPYPGKRFQSLLLTASLDWSVKLWNVGGANTHSSTHSGNSVARGGASKHAHSGQNAPLTPLFEFVSPSYDYVNDVHWCPTNPSVFLTLTSCGSLSVWSLCKSTSEPTETISLSEESITGSLSTLTGKEKESVGKVQGMSAGSHAALNKAVWSRNGRLIIVGDSKGAVHMLHVHDSVHSMTAADEGKLEVLLLGSGSGSGGSSSAGRVDVTASVDSAASKLEKISLDED